MTICTKVCGLVLGAVVTLTALPADAAKINTSYKACSAAIVEQLGEGNVRQNLLVSKARGDQRTQWINVRHRPSADAEVQRLRAQCETADGAVTELDLQDGTWKKTRPNRAPKAVD